MNTRFRYGKGDFLPDQAGDVRLDDLPMTATQKHRHYDWLGEIQSPLSFDHYEPPIKPKSRAGVLHGDIEKYDRLNKARASRRK